MKGMRSSAFPCANVPTLEGTRSMTVRGIEPLFLVSRLLTCIMTDVMADYQNGLQNGLQTLEKKIKFMIEISTIRTSLQHEKAVPCFRNTEKLIFVQHSSEYETSDSDRKVNLNI